MVDRRDDDASPDTQREPATVRGVGVPPADDDDIGSAHTSVATPLPPPPPAGNAQATEVASPRAAASGRMRRDSGTPRDGSRYALKQVLGEGGMGEVLLAFDEQIGREVAVKRIRAEDPTAEELARFLREARVQGRLEHPAVVPVHDLVIDGSGKPFFVMKRLSGTDMHELLKRLRAGDEPDEAACRRRLLRAFADVCLAIAFAHKNGIIHRDLKPANVMLGDFGEVYVLDWGVARALAEDDTSQPTPTPRTPRTGPASGKDLELSTGATQVGTVLGTPAYMAPEQLVGERATPAADVYALGCMLFEITAGEPLHPRSRSLGAAMLPVDARPSKRRPDSPPELDAICARATQIDPAARYDSALALGNAVQAFLDGDRDIAVRRELAAHHIAEAREALARGDSEGDRKDAMRAAGRALALDPTASEAADLVTHLMLRPPPQVPREVEQGLATIDTETARVQGRVAAIAMLGYLAFVPLLLWTGVQQIAIVIVFAAVAMTSGTLVFLLTRRDRITTGPIYASAFINAILIGIVCRMVGPFIIAPTLVVTTLMAYASHPQLGRIGVLASILGAAVVVPWVLELVGVTEATYRFEGGAIILTSPIVTYSSVPVQISFALLLVSLIAVVAALSRSIAKRQRAATRRLEIQAWHLRQIVPTATR